MSEIDTSTEAVTAMSRKLRGQDGMELPWRMDVADMHDALAAERDAIKRDISAMRARAKALAEALRMLRGEEFWPQCAEDALTAWDAAQ